MAVDRFSLIQYRRKSWPTLLVSALAIAGCDGGDLPDFGQLGGFKDRLKTNSTSEATTDTAPRPKPDDRGVISYPNYHVIVARRGDTMNDVAARVGMTGADLAQQNGLSVDYLPRGGEVLALPKGAAGTFISGSSLEEIATTAIDNAGETPITTTTISGPEPIRHVVEPGETAYSVARLYGVSVTALASWNGLDRNLSVREGQQILIPVAQDGAPAKTVDVAAATDPGAGTITPTPPSAKTPLPEKVETVELPDSPNLSADRTPPGASRKLLKPVSGNIIQAYGQGGNEGINIGASAGSSVKAAEDGEIALISNSSGQNTIVLIRHPDNLYTVYSNISDVTLSKGQSVRRGQSFAKVASGSKPYLHFEIRRGTESVDPAPYL